MYLSIIILPLLGSIVSGFFGRKVGVRGAQIITCSCVTVTTILALLAFIEVGFNNIPVTINLFRWIDSEWFNIIWGFQFDSLTVSMLLNFNVVINQNKRFYSSDSEFSLTKSTKLESDVMSCRSFNFEVFNKKFLEFYSDKKLPSREFLEWFVGFVEGEGSFTVSKYGKFLLTIYQASFDVQVLHYVQDNLGFGSVGQVNEKVSRLVLSNTRNIYLLCLLFNGNMVLPTRGARFLTFLAAFNENLIKRNIFSPIKPIMDYVKPSLNDCWLLGFVDGEGCFTFSLLSTSNRFRYSFILTQKGVANKDALEHLLSLFNGHGLVYCRRNNGSDSDILDLKITGLANCTAIFPYFDKLSLKTKKLQSYLKWKEIYPRLVKKDHLIADKRQELMILVKKNQ